MGTRKPVTIGVVADGAVTPVKTSFVEYKYQYLSLSDKISGAYYRRDGIIALAGTADCYPPFRVYAGTYNFHEVYGYFSHIKYDDETFVNLSDEVATAHYDGSITLSQDGWAYISVALEVSDSMFSLGDLPDEYTEGFYDLSITDIQPITTEVTVDISGNGDYTSLRTCLESISPTEKRPYIVNILPGEYDIKSYYTVGEWIESTLFRGLYIPDYVTLVGIGNRENIILYVDETTPAKQYISPINLKNTAGMENVTVRGKYTRYAVHDDKGDVGADYQRRVKNCHFIAENTYYNNTYGSGCKSGADWDFEDCIFDNLTTDGTAFSNHNSIETATKGNKIKFTNCRLNVTGANAYAMSFGSLANNADGMITEVTVNGCKGTGKLRLKEESAVTYGAGIVFRVKGFYSTFTATEIVNTDGLDYSGNVDII